MLTRFESEDPRAVGGIADDGEGDNRHRVTLTQCTRQTDGESAALSGLAPAHKRHHGGRRCSWRATRYQVDPTWVSANQYGETGYCINSKWAGTPWASHQAASPMRSLSSLSADRA